MKVVEPDYSEMLIQTHRRWILERTPQASDAFTYALMASIEASRKRARERPLTHPQY